MWNCGALTCCPATRLTPRITCTNTDASTATVNHHSARVRRPAKRVAASDHAPARPLPMMTTHAQPVWRSSRPPVATRWCGFSDLQGSDGRGPDGGSRHRRHRLGLALGLGGDVDQLDDLFL